MHVSQSGQTACRKCAMPEMWDEVEGSDDYDRCMTCPLWQHSLEDGPLTTVCTSCFASADVMLSMSNCGVMTMLIITAFLCSVSGMLYLVRELKLLFKETSSRQFVDAQQKLLENPEEDPEIADPQEAAREATREVSQEDRREVSREGTRPEVADPPVNPEGAC
ncbi:unnamed protein product [Prorocentrum cordatum]|uniref:Uncharacterized protein n=1 Tax=Prorocentrum cordatum TaxID=2364126 RepID=A0ABN9XUF3_9DINO|nr:unnamed protein product [Polarella glacialis]